MDTKIFKSSKILRIGTVLKAGMLGFTGSVRDFEGNLVGDGKVVVMILREATKDEFLSQFEVRQKRVFESTLSDIDSCKFYEISTD